MGAPALIIGGQIQQPDYLSAELFDLKILRGQPQSAAGLEISYGTSPAGFCGISSLCKSVVGQAPSKMCGHTHISWIHYYCRSQTIDCSLCYPLLYPWGNCAF